MSQRDSGDADVAPRDDLLSAMLALDERGLPVMSQAEICDNVKTFLFAGHDTTAAALTWSVHLPPPLPVASHPVPLWLARPYRYAWADRG